MRYFLQIKHFNATTEKNQCLHRLFSTQRLKNRPVIIRYRPMKKMAYSITMRLSTNDRLGNVIRIKRQIKRTYLSQLFEIKYRPNILRKKEDPTSETMQPSQEKFIQVSAIKEKPVPKSSKEPNSAWFATSSHWVGLIICCLMLQKSNVLGMRLKKELAQERPY